MRRYLFTLTALLFLVGPMLGETFFYVADHNNRKLLKVKTDGTVVWFVANGNGHDVQVLPNKNLLFINGKIVQEITPDKQVVWSVGAPTVINAESAQRLKNGNTMIADNGTHKIIDVDKDKKVVWEYDVPNTTKRMTTTMRQVRRIEETGNTLICASTEDKVLEVSPDKKIVWSYDVPFPYLALRLPNGNTLISSGDGYGSPKGWFVIEVNKEGKEVWKYGGEGKYRREGAAADERAEFPTGLLRLPNGNTIFTEAQGKKIREVTPDHKIVRIIQSPDMPHPTTFAMVEENETAAEVKGVEKK